MPISRLRRNRTLRLLSQQNGVDGNTVLGDTKAVTGDVVLAEAERKGVAYIESGGFLEEVKVALWDQVAERWTSPLPQVTATMNLRVIVDKCSVCVSTSNGLGGKANWVDTHIHNAVASGELHKQAEIQTVINQDGQASKCTACDLSFRARPMNAFTHIQEVIDKGEAHKRATKLVMRRFLSEPPVVERAQVPVIAMPTPLAGESQHPERSRRRRSRGGKKKVANVS